MLDANGFPEMQRRRRGRLGFGRYLGGLLVIPVLAAGVYAHARLSRRPIWTIGAIQVEGNRSLSTAEVLERLRIHPGMPWWTLHPGAARTLRSEEPRIESLALSWRWPRDLHVGIRERESVVRVLSIPPLELSADGILMDGIGSLDPADLPLLTGALPSPLLPGKPFRFAEGTWWPTLLGVREHTPDLWKEISEIHLDADGSFRVFLRGGHRVILWEDGINDALWEQIPGILSDLRKQHADDAVLDLRFRKQVVVRLPHAEVSASKAALASAVRPDGAAHPPGRQRP